MIEFTVHGEPIPQGSMKAFIVNGRANMVPDNKPKLLKWRKAVNTVAMELWGEKPPTDQPLRIGMEFHFGPAPKSHQGEIWCATRFDGDKLVRAIFDSLTHFTKNGKVRQRGLVTNDSRFVQHQGAKFWCDTEQDQRAVIKIEGLSVPIYGQETRLL